MPEDSFEAQHAKSLETYRQEKESLVREKAELLKQLADERARREMLEKSSKYRTITLDTIIRDPVLSTKQDNTIRYVNPAYVRVSGYVESDVIGKPITEFVRGLEFLTQFHEYPELIDAESAESLQKVHITLSIKNKEELRMTANVGFSPGETPGYNGVTIICEPKVDKAWYKRLASFIKGPWFSRWYVIKAKEYAEKGIITLPDSPLESREISAAERLLQEATREVMKPTNRGVAIKFEGVTSCSTRMYELLVSVAKVHECPFTCFVDENSAILAGFREVHFPDKHLKIIKKKNKREKEK